MKTIAAERNDTAAPFALASHRHVTPVTAHPVLRGDSKYLRALRAAEMVAWEASLPLALAESFAQSVATADREEVDKPEALPHSFGTFFA